MSSVVSSMTEEIDLKKKLKKKLGKALFSEGELQKGVIADWAQEFSYTEKWVEVLELARDIHRCYAERTKELAEYSKPWREVDAMSPIKRAEYQQRAADIEKKHQKRLDELLLKKDALQDWLIDYKIEQAKLEMKRQESFQVPVTVPVRKAVAHRDRLKGGLADKKKPSDFDPKALAQGTKVEREHSKDRGIAQEVAMDHLTEDPKYYKKLARMEAAKKSLEDAALARLMKGSSSPDVDIDPGRMGVADYTGEEGQVAMRVRHNQKCAGCSHYAVNHSACSIGLLPSVCGDGSYPEVGYAPAQPNRIAAKNWVSRHQDAVVEPSQSANVGTGAGDVSYRVEVLGDSALALSERMTLVKAAARDWGAIAGHIWHHVAGPKARAKWAHAGCGGKKPEEGKGRPPAEFVEHIKAKARKGRKLARSLEGDWVAKALSDLTGVVVLPHLDEVDLSKGKLTLGEFADAMGTTGEIVRSIARRLGDKDHFAHFIKSKLPDIQIAHGLTDADMAQLYRAAVGTIARLSPTDWRAWKGVGFEDGVTDDALATAIQQHGLLDMNAMVPGGIITRALPVQQLPDPEPIGQPLVAEPVKLGFVGGNLHLANDLHRL